MTDNLYEATGIKSGRRVKVTIKERFSATGTMKLSVTYKTFEIGDEFEGKAVVFLKRRDCVEIKIPQGAFPLPLDKIILQEA